MDQNMNIYSNNDANVKLNKDTVCKPFFSYFLYLTLRICKMPSTWILIIMSWLVIFALTILPVLFAPTDRELLLSLFFIVAIFSNIIFAGTMGSMKSLNIFKDGENDGTELLIVSKPISRAQILFARFVFLLLFGLLYIVIQTVLVAIAMAVVGWTYYPDVWGNILGMFGAGILSFLFMGIIATVIGIKISGKLARVLPSVILSLSVVISFMSQQLTSFLSISPSNNEIAKIQKYMDSNLTGIEYGGQQVTDIYFPPGEIMKWQTFVHYQDAKTGQNYIYLQTFKASYGNSDITIDAGLLRNETDRNLYISVMQKVADYTIKNIKSFSPNAWLLLDYLNPCSAFATIANIGDAFGSTIFQPYGLPYNYAFSNMSLNSTPINPPRALTSIPISIAVKDAIKVNSPEYVAAAWSFIFVFLTAFTVWAYSRKDFK